MCEQGDTVLANVIRPSRGNVADVDRCIAPIVEAINTAGVQTIAACCGHGARPGSIILADDREILIMASREDARALDGMWPAINPPELGTTVRVKWLDSSSPNTWCGPRTAKALVPYTINTIGVLIAQSTDHVTVAAHVGSDEDGDEIYDGVMCIPRRAILSVVGVEGGT